MLFTSGEDKNRQNYTNKQRNRCRKPFHVSGDFLHDKYMFSVLAGKLQGFPETGKEFRRQEGFCRFPGKGPGYAFTEFGRIVNSSRTGPRSLQFYCNRPGKHNQSCKRDHGTRQNPDQPEMTKTKKRQRLSEN